MAQQLTTPGLGLRALPPKLPPLRGFCLRGKGPSRDQPWGPLSQACPGRARTGGPLSSWRCLARAGDTESPALGGVLVVLRAQPCPGETPPAESPHSLSTPDPRPHSSIPGGASVALPWIRLIQESLGPRGWTGAEQRVLCLRPPEGDLLGVLDLGHCHPSSCGEAPISWVTHSTDEGRDGGQSLRPLGQT